MNIVKVLIKTAPNLCTLSNQFYYMSWKSIYPAWMHDFGQIKYWDLILGIRNEMKEGELQASAHSGLNRWIAFTGVLFNQLRILLFFWVVWGILLKRKHVIG